VSVVYPGVDLQEFSPALPPISRRFRILFASSPADPAEFTSRGIPFLVDLARARNDIEVVLLWRSWGNACAAQRALGALQPPANVVIEARGMRTMADVYRSVHATACCYDAGFGKSCPNSIVESAACGRPVLVTSTCGIADLIAQSGAGVTFPRTIDAAVAAVDRLRQSYERCSADARRLARNHFDVNTFVSSYLDLYERLAGAA
jgi:glycosyltransferase involved in cell wall biosynthesis